MNDRLGDCRLGPGGTSILIGYPCYTHTTKNPKNTHNIKMGYLESHLTAS